MEMEKFISGYCRQIDRSRMVSVELEDGVFRDADCCYGSCAYEPDCPIAKEIRELAKAGQTVE